uniref:Uncharacterized protein n=1 Tax=Avena sativa TaxID=4498 RepID=A0ACD5VFV6_AVESA
MEEMIGMIKLFLVELFILVVVGSTREISDGRNSGVGRRLAAAHNLPVPLTLLTSAVDKGAVCIDGSPPAYHLDPGFDAGKNRWIVNLEGGGWCDNVRGCLYRKASRLGSSNLMDKHMYFAGIMSAGPVDNPDFYNWNRVMIRYCDGASFAGEGYDSGNGLYFRGQRIFNAAIQYFLSIGMASADQVLLTGTSAGALAVMLHCDQFSGFFAGQGTTVKCLADAGLFLDAVDVSGGRTLRSYYEGVIATHGVAQNLPKSCTGRLDATSCFFPQNIIGSINTPIFLLNAAYDTWQIRESLAPDRADPSGTWRACKSNRSACDASQIIFLQAFRGQMVATVQGFSDSKTNGFFINSCFIHGQSENRATWNADGSPAIQNKDIGKSVGDWYFGRAQVKAIDCPYPCDNTCHHDI